MRLTVVGCSGTVPGPDAACSAYLVEHDNFRLLLDAGPGSIGALQRSIGLLDLDAVVLSHLHPDHWLDMVCYTYARRYHPDGPSPSLPVYAPIGSSERIMAAFEGGGSEMLHDIYNFSRLDGKPAEIGPFQLDFIRTNHPIECYAMRVRADGRTFVYSADTGDCPGLVDLAKDSDLFLCEAAWGTRQDAPPDLHLSGREAGQHARRAETQHLLVTHLMPWADREGTYEDAARAFGGETTLAKPRTTYDV